MAVYENTVPGMQVIHSFLVYQLSGTGGYQEEEKGSKVFTLAGVGPEARRSPGDESAGTLQIWRGYRSHAVKLPDLREIVNYP